MDHEMFKLAVQRGIESGAEKTAWDPNSGFLKGGMKKLWKGIKGGGPKIKPKGAVAPAKAMPAKLNP